MRASLLCLVVLLVPRSIAAQAPETVPSTSDTVVALSLGGAVQRATEDSDEVRLARARVSITEAQIGVTRAEAFPQISGRLAYTRTIESPFGGGSEISGPVGPGFDPDSTLSLAERVSYLERNVPTAALDGLAGSFGDLPFGQDHTYVAQITGTQLLYSGGRVGSALDIARRIRTQSELNLAEDVAEIELQVRRSYYQALLARELAVNAAEALAQAEEFLAREQLGLEAGESSELDVLRAEVSRDNLRPQLVEAQNAEQIAVLTLKRLVGIDLSTPLELTTPLAVPTQTELSEVGPAPDLVLAQRARIRAAEEQVGVRRGQEDVAFSAFLPEVSVGMTYGQQLLPEDAFDFDGDWRPDWSANLSVEIPIFNGGRRGADLSRARVEVLQAELQLDQLRATVAVEYEQALGERGRAREAIDARGTTVQVAERVHDLTVLQYEQGQATQLEVSDARLELLNARTNLAQAIADFRIAAASLERARTSTPSGPLDERLSGGNR